MSLEEKARQNDIESYLSGKQPSPEQLAAGPRLDDWVVKIRRGPGGEFEMTLQGRVTGHRRMLDGTEATTTPVIWLDRKHKWARTLNTLYALGEPAGEEIPLDGVDL